MYKKLVIGTAGHIDHGKTALIKHLTGIHTDRLKEERKRGITIENGFAHLKVTPELTVGFIDVPGHERFIKTMLSGATGMDAFMLVVAADESIMPQTREHLQILKHLGVEKGIVVITKSDLVDAAFLELVTEEVTQYLTSEGYTDVPIFPYSVFRDEGKDAVIECIQSFATELSEGIAHLPARMHVDRVFSMKGHGTVITGTLLEGQVSVGDVLYAYPSGEKCRIKGIQAYGSRVETAYYGQRTALNLAVPLESIHRGDVLSADGAVRLTQCIGARLDTDAFPGELVHNQRFKLYHGTREILCRIHTSARMAIPENAQNQVIFKLEAPLYCKVGDPYVLRTYSPMHTVGGGTITDAHASAHAAVHVSNAETEVGIDAEAAVFLNVLSSVKTPVFEPKAFYNEAHLVVSEGDHLVSRLEQQGVLMCMEPGRYMRAESWDAVIEGVLSELDAFHLQYPLRRGAAKETLRSKLPKALKLNKREFGVVLAYLVDSGTLEVHGDAYQRAGHHHAYTDAERREKARILDFIEAYEQPVVPMKAILDTAQNKNMCKELLNHLIIYEILVKMNDEVVIKCETYQNFLKSILAHFDASDTLTVAECRDLLGISRKATVEILEYFDDLKITRREGNIRTRIN